MKGEAGKEVSWERRASCGEYGFGRHRENVNTRQMVKVKGGGGGGV